MFVISGKFLKYKSLSLLFASAVLASSLAQASDLRVNLVATVDNGPALKEVNWTVYRTDSDRPVKQADNHSTHVLLPAGQYRAVATLISNNKRVTRSRDFYVRTPNSRIIVPMD